MVELTPLGTEFESVIVAVLMFLFGGVICFLGCFTVTQCYLCYKRRILRKKRRRDRSDDYGYPMLDDEPSEEVFVVDHAKSGKKLKVHGLGRPSISSQGSSHTSGSTRSTNA